MCAFSRSGDISRLPARAISNCGEILFATGSVAQPLPAPRQLKQVCRVPRKHMRTSTFSYMFRLACFGLLFRPLVNSTASFMQRQACTAPALFPAYIAIRLVGSCSITASLIGFMRCLAQLGVRAALIPETLLQETTSVSLVLFELGESSSVAAICFVRFASFAHHSAHNRLESYPTALLSPLLANSGKRGHETIPEFETKRRSELGAAAGEPRRILQGAQRRRGVLVGAPQASPHWRPRAHRGSCACGFAL